MKSFAKYIIEEVISFEDALRIFNIQSAPVSKDDLDKLYKKLALKTHPDLGGSTEAMKKLNMAKDVLSKNLGTPSRMQQQKNAENLNREYEQCFFIAMNFFSKIDLDVYKAFFANIFNDVFYADIKKKEWKSSSYSYLHNTPSIDVEIYTKDRSKVFYLSMWADLIRLHNAIFTNNSITAKNVVFDYTITSSSFVENKKQVITKERFLKNSNANVLKDPTVVFPKDRIQKLAAGTVRQNSTLKKRDFESLMLTKYKGEQYKDWYFIPFNETDTDEYFISVYRTVLMKKGCYTFGDIYAKSKVKKFLPRKSVAKVPIHYMEETKETFDALDALFKFAKTAPNLKTVYNKVKEVAEKTKSW